MAQINLAEWGQKALDLGVTNSLGLDLEFLGAIGFYFQDFEKNGELDLFTKLIRYVVDGEDPDTLNRIKGSAQISNYLGFNQHGIPYCQWILSNRIAPPALWLRLSNIFAAALPAADCNKQKTTLVQKGGVPNCPDGLKLLFGMILNLHSLPNATPWNAVEIEKLLAEANQPTSLIVQLILNPTYRSSLGILNLGTRDNDYFSRSVTGLNECFQRHSVDLSVFLQSAKPEHQFSAMEILSKVNFDGKDIVPTLVKLATGASDKPRELALKLLEPHAAEARPMLEELLKKGDNAERKVAAEALAYLLETQCFDHLREHLLGERSDGVKQTILKLVSAPPRTVPQLEKPQLPPVNINTGSVGLPEGFETALRAMVSRGFRRNYEDALKRWQKEPSLKEPTEEKISDEAVKGWLQFIETGTLPEPSLNRSVYVLDEDMNEFIPPDAELIHVVRTHWVFHTLHIMNHHIPPQDPSPLRVWYNFEWKEPINAFRGKSQKPFGLRELDKCVSILPDIKPRYVLVAYLRINTRQPFLEWPKDDIWPAFVENMDLIEDALNQTEYPLDGVRDVAVKVLSMMPYFPRECFKPVFKIALGELEGNQKNARKALSKVPDITERILYALKDSEQKVRWNAVEWLAERGEKGAIEPIKQALAIEKTEVGRGRILRALGKLGANLSEFINREQLFNNAKSEVAGKSPNVSAWVELNKLPPLHWVDTGACVDGDITKWFVVKSIEQKSPEPNPIIKAYLGMCHQIDTATLARTVLSAFIKRDLERIPFEEAEEQTEEEVERDWKSAVGFFVQQGISKTRLYYERFAKNADKFSGTAIDQMGMLAVVAAAGDASCVALCEQYINEYCDKRKAQSKILVDVLGSMESPFALHLLISYANRFKSHEVNLKAAEYVQGAANANGWTIDELTDRTIPRPPANDKTALNDVQRKQQERLYDALCTQREWVFRDWRTHLAEHPVVGEMCNRLVWTAVANGKVTGTFRPLPDLSLINELGEKITLPDDSKVAIAHRCTISLELVSAWLRHFNQNKIKPPFEQFANPPFTVKAGSDFEVTDYAGYIIGGFKLGKIARGMGYIRNIPHDSDRASFHKPFPSIGIDALIGYSDDLWEEEDHPWALYSLYFKTYLPTHKFLAKKIQLSKIPPVLLAECFGDFRRIAEAGTGFDPNWEKRF